MRCVLLHAFGRLLDYSDVAIFAALHVSQVAAGICHLHSKLGSHHMQERKRKQEQQQVEAPSAEEPPADLPAPEAAAPAGELSLAPLTLAQVAAANLSEGDAAADAQVRYIFSVLLCTLVFAVDECCFKGSWES